MSCFADLLLGDLGPDSDQILLDDASLTELILGEAGATDGSGFDLLSSVTEGTEEEAEALQRQPDPVELQHPVNNADTPQQQQFNPYQQVTILCISVVKLGMLFENSVCNLKIWFNIIKKCAKMNFVCAESASFPDHQPSNAGHVSWTTAASAKADSTPFASAGSTSAEGTANSTTRVKN